jgi:DNA-binding beta-propeller fold protein YncE
MDGLRQVLHCGYGENEIVIIALESRKIVSQARVNEAFYGLAFSPKGNELYCSGGSDEVLHVFPIKNGKLGESKTIALRDAKERGIPGGIAVAKDGTKYVTNVWAHSISRVRGKQVNQLTLTEEAGGHTCCAGANNGRSVDHQASGSASARNTQPLSLSRTPASSMRSGQGSMFLFGRRRAWP